MTIATMTDKPPTVAVVPQVCNNVMHHFNLLLLEAWPLPRKRGGKRVATKSIFIED